MIDILFSLAGIIILIKGKVNVSSKRAVSGIKARVLGGLFILCLPVGYLLRIVLVNFKEFNYVWLGFVYPALLIVLTVIFIVSCPKKTEEVPESSPA